MTHLISLIVLVLTFAINLMVAGIMLGFLPQITVIPKEYRLFTEAIVLMLFLIALSFTPAARFLFRWSYNFKKPNPEELARLQQILKPVMEAAGKELTDFRIYIAEQKTLNAYAAGYNELAVTRPLLALSDYELQGILAHEVGHLHYKDSVQLTIIATLNFITVVSFKILNIINVILCIFVRIPCIGLVAALMSWTILIFSLIVLFLSVFPQKIGIILSRQQEYRVDKYAAKLGFGEHLIRGLQRIDTTDKPSLWNRVNAFLKSTHPSTYDRIEKIKQVSA